ncbi:condensation domain-containing protein [Streptosporangium lutulentum]|uniref:Acyl carrier protein n=1 Tax=Streptosporangium lutulentum TaxID=1461250 RepID=A0ABT9QIH2_9ACTN|nr:condensation domain-containing protein [Streptosporangium lutulentum]MDP9845754.1 acyl carrier protein [Streptosporangium lutulentum]
MTEATFAERGAEVTFTQQGMWVTEQNASAGSAYHMPLLVHLNGELDVEALLAACAAVVDRHPMLGSVVAEAGNELRLLPGAPVPVRRAPARDAHAEQGTHTPERDAQAGQDTHTPGEGAHAGEGAHVPERDAHAAVREEILRGFDLEKGPLARFTLFEVAPDRHLLLFVAHHLVFDGQSKDILVRDLAAFYNGEPPPPLPEIDHGRAERDRVAAALPAAREFWKPRWRDPGETVVLGRVLRSRRAGEGRVVRFTADPSIPGLTRFEALLAALHVCLLGYGNAEVTTAVDLSTRPPEAAGHIGLFVNELPVASGPSPETTFRAFAAALRAELREVYRFRQVPLSRAMPRIRPHAALVPVSVSYRTRHDPDPAFTGLDASVEWTVSNHAVRGALHLQCVDGPGGLEISLRHDPDAVPDADRVAADLRLLLERAHHDPDLRLTEILENEMGSVTTLTDQVREIWEEVLGISPIDDHDDIFDLGGHSLTITQIIARMRKRLDVEVSLDDFFDNPTIAGVVESLDAAGGGTGTDDD